MKWNNYEVGVERIVEKFLFFPLRCKINGTCRYETRWLCFVRIKQFHSIYLEWINICFIDGL
jgi:hypothetical protein